MTDDTKRLLKSAASNSASVLGYVSTAATFFPIGNIARPYVRWGGLVLIIVGVCRGAQAVIEDKNREITEAPREKDRHVEELRTQKDSEIAELNARIVQLSRKRYAEDLERDVRELLAKLSDDGRRMVIHLLKNAPIENGRSFLNDIPIERQQAQLEIARQSGIVRGEQDKTGLMRAYWVINERFRPALEDLLYQK
jgi:hypothetical protein